MVRLSSLFSTKAKTFLLEKGLVENYLIKGNMIHKIQNEKKHNINHNYTMQYTIYTLCTFYNNKGFTLNMAQIRRIFLIFNF